MAGEPAGGGGGPQHSVSTVQEFAFCATCSGKVLRKCDGMYLCPLSFFSAPMSIYPPFWTLTLLTVQRQIWVDSVSYP